MVGTILTAEYTFISRALEAFSRMDHIVGHKTNLKKFNKVEIMPSIFSDHSGTKLEINNSRVTEETQIHENLNKHSSKQPMGQRKKCYIGNKK